MLHTTEDICVPISAIKTRPKTIHDAMRRIKVAFGRSQAAFSGKSYSLTRSIERRDDVRSPVEIPIFIHPVSLTEDQVKYEQSQPVVGLTQDISLQGLGYSYDEPLRGRYAVIEIDLFNSGPLKLLVERRWHRKIESHSYVGGAVVIGILP